MNGVRPSSFTFMSSVDIQIMAWTIGHGSLHDCMAVHQARSVPTLGTWRHGPMQCGFDEANMSQ